MENMEQVQEIQEKPVSKTYLNRLLKPVMFFVFALLLEFVNFVSISISSKYVDFSLLPEFIGFDLGVFFIFSAIILIAGLAKRLWLQNVIYYILAALQVVLNITNSIILKSSGSVFNFQLFELATEGLAAFAFNFIDFIAIALNLAAVALIIAGQILVDKYLKKELKIKKAIKYLLLTSLSVILCFSGVISYSLTIQNLSNFEEKYYWNDLSFKLHSFKMFGTYGFYTKDFFNYYLKADLAPDRNLVEKYISENAVAENPSATLYDNNLIMIMLESFDWFAIDPYNTPNLWKLFNESIVFEQYVANNKTNVSEAISLLGYMPDVPLLDIKDDDWLSTAYSLPNLFSEAGYTSRYFHSWKKDFYDRNINNKNLGFDELYFLEDAHKLNKKDIKLAKWAEWNTEVDYFETLKEYIAPTDGSKFMSFYLTVATHGGYDKDLKNFDDCFELYEYNLKNTDFIDWFESEGFNFPDDQETRKYLRQLKATAIDTDKMIGKLLEHLETELPDGTKLIDNTTLVLFADHNTYYNDLAYTIKGTDRSNYANLKNYSVPFAIYSKGNLEHQKVTSYVNCQDIYPTVCDLFGLSYNKFMCQGYNVFDTENNHIYYSQLTGYYNKDFYSLNIFDVYKTNQSATEEDEAKFIEDAKAFYEKQKILTQIYKSKFKL